MRFEETSAKAVFFSLACILSNSSALSQTPAWSITTTALNHPSLHAVEFIAHRATMKQNAAVILQRQPDLHRSEFCDRLRKQTPALYVASLAAYRACFQKTSLLGAMDFPFLAKDWSEAQELLNGPIGVAVAEGLRQNGATVLSFWDGETTVLSSSKRIMAAADLKGSKVVSPQTFASTSTISLAGGVSMSLPGADIVTALGTGVADTADVSLSSYKETFAKIHKSALLSNHSLDPYVVTVPAKAWKTLAGVERAFIESLIRQATALQVKRANTLRESQLAELRAHGVNVVSISDAGRESFRSASLLNASAQRASEIFGNAPQAIQIAASSQAVGKAQSTYIQVFFVTNRVRTAQSFTRNIGSDLWYSKAEVELDYEQSVLMPAELFGNLIRFAPKGKGVQIDWSATVKATLPKELAKVEHDLPTKAPLIYVHGFANTLEKAVRHGAWLSWNTKRPVLTFAWPSQGLRTLGNYRTDQQLADQSAAALAQVLKDIGRDYDTAKDVDVVIHSMGGRVALAALNRLNGSSGSGTSPKFRQLVLIAPDVSAGDLACRWKSLHKYFGSKATLYVSNHDLALGISRTVMNPTEGPRAGLSPPVFVADDIESVFIGPNEFSLTGHSYHVANGEIVDDLMEVLRYSVPAIKRRGIELSASGLGYFEIKRLRSP